MLDKRRKPRRMNDTLRGLGDFFDDTSLEDAVNAATDEAGGMVDYDTAAAAAADAVNNQANTGFFDTWFTADNIKSAAEEAKQIASTAKQVYNIFNQPKPLTTVSAGNVPTTGAASFVKKALPFVVLYLLFA